MKKFNREDLANTVADVTQRPKVEDRLAIASKSDISAVYQMLASSEEGKTKEEVEASREQYGSNIISYHRGQSVLKRLVQAFINPFTLILIALALVSIFTDIILVRPEEKIMLR